MHKSNAFDDFRISISELTQSGIFSNSPHRTEVKQAQARGHAFVKLTYTHA